MVMKVGRVTAIGWRRDHVWKNNERKNGPFCGN